MNEIMEYLLLRGLTDCDITMCQTELDVVKCLVDKLDDAQIEIQTLEDELHRYE